MGNPPRSSGRFHRCSRVYLMAMWGEKTGRKTGIDQAYGGYQSPFWDVSLLSYISIHIHILWFSNLTTSSFLQVDQTVVLKALGLEASQWRVGLRKCFLSHSCVVTGSPFIQGSGNPTWPLWHCRQPCHSLSLAFALTSNLGTSCGICEKGSAAFFRGISWFWGNRLDIGSWHPFPSSSGSQTPSVLPIILVAEPRKGHPGHLWQLILVVDPLELAINYLHWYLVLIRQLMTCWYTSKRWSWFWPHGPLRNWKN